MPIPLIDLSGQHKALRKELARSTQKIFDSQRFVLGEENRLFEEAVAKKTGAAHAIGLASGSDALYLAFLALDIGDGAEVITTPFSFFATAGSISRAGAKPVFADVDPLTFNLDPKAVQAKMTSRTRAILPVHLFGLPCDMDRIRTVARRKSIRVIEDAAQAFGAEYKGKAAGALSDVGCFSFYPTKNLGGAGDGGMLVTSSTQTAEKVRLLRDHGSRTKYRHEFVGLNSRLDELQAAVLLVKLKHIDEWNRKRRALARIYDEGLEGLPLRVPATPAGATSVYHLYSIVTEKRDRLKEHLAKKGIGTGVYYPLPLHLQPCYRALGHRRGDFPEAERLAETILSLPMYPELSPADVRKTVEEIRAFFRKSK